MRKLLFICSMFIASQAFTIEGINSNYDNDQVTEKGCKPHNGNTRNLCPIGSTGPRGEKGHCGERGRKGAAGKKGARGAQGPVGSRGPTGPRGVSSAPTIIPFASGSPVTLISVSPITNEITQAMLGFGVNFPIVGVEGNINITFQTGDTSFTMPRDGEITSISAKFNNGSPFELFSGTLTVQANVYVAPEGSNLFVFQDKVDLTPTLTAGPIGPGTLLQGTKALSIPVNNEDRILVVFSVTNSLNEVIGLQGFASAGLTIE